MNSHNTDVNETVKQRKSLTFFKVSFEDNLIKIRKLNA